MGFSYGILVGWEWKEKGDDVVFFLGYNLEIWERCWVFYGSKSYNKGFFLV